MGDRLIVVGQGYVGLPLAMRAVEVGFDVLGVEADERRVKRLDAGQSYVEDVSDATLGAALATDRYHVTDGGAGVGPFDMAVIAVPTPLREGAPDLSYIEDAATLLGADLAPGATVVLESTTWPGTTTELVQPLLESRSGLIAGIDFHLGYSPERIDPGNAQWMFRNTPKVVSGIDAASLAAVAGFYDRLVDRTVAVSGTQEAELTKLLENTFRHVNIALVNELAVFAHELGIDLWEAIDAASTKPFGFMPFRPGPGVGGHCLPVDPSYLSWRIRRTLGRSFRFVELANDVNDHMPDHVVARVTAGLNRRSTAVKGSRVLLLGLTYKKDTRDARESPAMVVAEHLVALGAEVHAVDRHALVEQVPAGVVLVPLSAAEVAAADAVVVLTDHDDVDYALVAQQATYVLDTRGRLTSSERVELL